MTNEEKKEYLKQYKQVMRKIKSLEDQRRELVETMISPKAVGYDDMPHGHRISDLSDIMVRLEKVMKAIDDKKKYCFSIKLSIEQSIANLDDGTESDILRMRYLQLKSWEKIAAYMGYDVRQVFRIHGRALYHFAPVKDVSECQ